MKINIIGAGIGGLTAGIALQKRGLNSQVYERAASFGTVGTGITIAANAMSILGDLGLAEAVTAAGQPISYLCVGRPDGTAISRLNAKRLSTALGYTSVGIHRADLHEILAEAFGHEKIHCDHQLTGISCTSADVSVEFANGARAHSDILVGADGLRSKVRELVLGESPLRDARQACWRGIVEVSALSDPQAVHAGEAWELWGHGTRFGYLRINRSQIYWFAVMSKELVDFPMENLDELRARFTPTWNATVQDILRSTPDDTIVAGPLMDREPAEIWHRERVVLLGDAIHPTTPNMGQGACMAIESAWALAWCLSKEADMQSAFSRYRSMRAARTTLVTKQSFRIGGMAHTLSPWKARLRNAIFTAVPVSIQERAMSRMLADTPLHAVGGA